jgi:hypothetical protein
MSLSKIKYHRNHHVLAIVLYFLCTVIRVTKRREKQQSGGDCTTKEFKDIKLLSENTVIVISMFNKICSLKNMKNSTFRAKQSSSVK